jgi:hypothetical protein
MSGIFDFLTSGTPPTTTSATTTTLPQWYEDYQKNLLSSSVAASQEPFQIYQGPRIASFTDKQNQALTQSADINQQWSPLTALAGSTTTRANAPFDPNAVAQYESPYLDQVTDIIGNRGLQRWNEKILPGVMDTFTGAGQFGSRRNMDFVTNAARDIQREIADEQTTALNQGYGTALAGYGQGRTTDLAAANQAANLGLGGLSALTNAGAAEQGLTQKSLDTAYQDFLEQRQYPWTQLGNLKSAAAGTAAPTSQTTAKQDIAGTPSGMSILTALSALLGGGSGA